MKVAICIWGLCRSTEHTYDSFKTNILNVLESNGIEYSIFLHTWNLFEKYHNPRAGERNVFLKNTTWKYYSPKAYCIENQTLVDPKLKLSSYRRHGDPWIQETIPEYTPFSCVDNVVRSLYSMNKATELWTSSNESFDIVMYVRPDVRFLKPFQIEWLTQVSDRVVYMPDFHLIDGVNDRFAFGKPTTMQVYGTRYKGALEYSYKNPLHSERFLAYILNKYKLSPCLLPFRFRRIRAGNITYHGDNEV
jgi:hypothetical protein